MYYDNASVGHIKLGTFMTEISRMAKLSREYTNHSCRATTVHVLDEAQVPSRHIMSVTGHKSESSLKTYSGKTCEKNEKFMSETISEKTLGKSSNTSNISEHDSLPDSIDFLALSHSNITVEVDENTGASTSSASSFELQALSNSQTENVLRNLLPDNDGFDDLIKVLDIPQQHQNNVANRWSKSLMNQLPAPFVNNCQNITINYNIFQRQ